MLERWLRQICPDWVARRLADVTPDWLRAHGIRAVLLDLDNTLVAWHEMSPPPEVREWLAALAAARMRTCLTSNTHRPQRLAAIAAALELPFEPGCAKPHPAGLRRALQRIGTAPAESALVGDQLFTDVLGGNWCGVTTVLVTPLSHREFVGTRWISRPAERLVLRALARRGWLWPVVPSENG
ncbi:MAG: YqeG family HAD IIIA-type phosphatase [Armatimonadetes bacterium]|nr:YqeG family HAD IIIA-type phosphatase [Armatimonadota bacterium]